MPAVLEAPANVDFVFNGGSSGDVGARLLTSGFDPLSLRPYVVGNGRNMRTYVDVRNGFQEDGVTPKYVPQQVTNATTLRKDAWKLLDGQVLKVAKSRLKAVADLQAAGLTFNIPNGMGTTSFEYEDESDINEADVSMDAINTQQRDRPVYNLKSIPLPIIHKDFSYSLRQIEASRRSGSPLDTTTAELAARRVSEKVEQFLLGTASDYTYAGGTIQGYTSMTGRLTKSMTAPTSSNHDVTVNEVLDMRALAVAQNHFGPFFCYCSQSWDQYMDEDYSGSKGDNTLRDRIGAIDGVDRPMTLDYLPANTLLLVEKDSSVVRMLQGMPVTTVRWESHGGFMVNFKVMTIMVPQLRADSASQTGIVEGTHA